MSDSAAPWTVARQAPLSMGFSRQGYCYHTLLQRIFLTRDWTQISRFAGGFFIAWATHYFSLKYYNLRSRVVLGRGDTNKSLSRFLANSECWFLLAVKFWKNVQVPGLASEIHFQWPLPVFLCVCDTGSSCTPFWLGREGSRLLEGKGGFNEDEGSVLAFPSILSFPSVTSKRTTGGRSDSWATNCKAPCE